MPSVDILWNIAHYNSNVMMWTGQFLMPPSHLLLSEIHLSGVLSAMITFCNHNSNLKGSQDGYFTSKLHESCILFIGL
jgi:hypothetical protein